jgi:hypothetical protein
MKNKPEAARLRMKVIAERTTLKDDWGLVILRADNGFVARTLPEKTLEAFKDDSEEDKNHVSSARELLLFILDFFNINPSRHERRRLHVIEEAGEKYMLREGEKFEKMGYKRVVKK